MRWNPEIYNKFKSERSAPFFDLLQLIKVRSRLHVVDLGCGTGELTKHLGEFLPDSKVLGIDSAPEMLQDCAVFSSDRVSFKCRSIETQMAMSSRWDLMFSNAALQWVADHRVFLPKMILRLKKQGQLIIQMPSQHHNLTNQLLEELANTMTFKHALKKWKRQSSVLETEEYSSILFKNHCTSMTVLEKIYPLALADANALFDWVSGTALIPYLANLPEKLKEPFKQEYRDALEDSFPESPLFYPFKRIIIQATF